MLSILYLPRGLNVILYMPLFFMILNQLVLYRYFEDVIRRVMYHKSRIRARCVVGFLTCLYFSMMMNPSILNADFLIYGIFSFIWAPQIMTNLYFGFRDRQFVYRFKFLAVQSAILLLLPFEARGGGVFFRSDYEESVFKLRPHPYMVIKLIWCFVFQITLLMLQQTNLVLNMQKICLITPDWVPCKQVFLRALRGYKLRKLKNIYIYTRKFEVSDYETLSETESSCQRTG